MSDGRSGTGINGEGQSSDAGTNGDRSSVDEPNGGEASYYFETDSLLVPQTAVEFEIQ